VVNTNTNLLGGNMGTCKTLETGNKVIYEFQPLIKGVCDRPADLTITTSALAGADGNAANIAVTALTAAALPEGMWLDFVAPTTGKIVPVQLTANVLTGATSLPVANIPEDIVSGSTCVLPAFLTARESGNLGRSGKTDSIEFLEDFYERTVTTGASWDISADGAYNQLSSSYRNCEFCFSTGSIGWARIVFPSPNPLVYSTGSTYEGEVTIGDLG
jgi:hypothetical protein